eukprot:TRINITY_DN38342_c0_g1_i1.p1 TRINITY_DN38342_c0_g1~~TRINITY_DN38342_c0_g1_i1.p1  ORF type:complete len:268 (-),score=14.43 TRINITY_DN38342_c0_g1_i1:105-908(-)
MCIRDRVSTQSTGEDPGASMTWCLTPAAMPPHEAAYFPQDMAAQPTVSSRCCRPQRSRLPAGADTDTHEVTSRRRPAQSMKRRRKALSKPEPMEMHMARLQQTLSPTPIADSVAPVTEEVEQTRVPVLTLRQLKRRRNAVFVTDVDLHVAQLKETLGGAPQIESIGPATEKVEETTQVERLGQPSARFRHARRNAVFVTDLELHIAQLQITMNRAPKIDSETRGELRVVRLGQPSARLKSARRNAIFVTDLIGHRRLLGCDIRRRRS